MQPTHTQVHARMCKHFLNLDFLVFISETMTTTDRVARLRE